MLILTVVTGPDKGTVFRLDDDGSHRIGRRHGAVPLADKGASSKHAEINRTDDGWTLTDLDSSNGTFLNKERIDLPTALHDGDRIQVGRSMLVFNVVETADLDEESMHEAGPTAAIHAALAAQHRNQQVLEEIKALLGDRPAGDETSEAAPAASAANDEIVALVRQVIDRLDRSAADEPGPDSRIDEVLDQLRAIRQREVVVPPAPEPTDLTPVLEAIDAIKSQQPAPAAAPEPVDLQPVLDAIESLKQSQPADTAAEPIDLTPVIQKIDALAARPQPEPTPVDFAPVLERLDQLKQSAPAVDLAPVTEKLDQLLEAATAPAEPVQASAVDLAPITAKLDELRASQPTVDLQPVLDAIESLKQSQPEPAPAPQPIDLTPVLEKLDAIREAQASDTPAAPEPVNLQPVLDAIAASKPADPTAHFDKLAEQITNLQSAIEQAATPDAAPSEPINLPELRDQLNAIRRGVELDRTGALAERLDRVLEAVNREPEPTDTAPAFDPAEIHQRLDDLRSKVNDLSTARLDEKIDQLLEIATSPSAPAAPASVDPAVIEKLEQVLTAVREAPKPEATDLSAVTDRIAELRGAIDSIAERAPQASSEGERSLLPQVLDRIDRMETALAERVADTGDTEAAVAHLGERIEAIVDVLRAMPAGGSDNDMPAAVAPAIDDEAISELNAKLEVIFEAIQQSRGERAATSDELDSLIDMVRNEHASTDTESALARVMARLDRMTEPAPTFDAELLERLEKVSIKLDKLHISGIDIPDPTPLLADTIEPLIRQIHDKVTHGEAVDLRGTEQRIAELTESVRDAINQSDRPLLEQILVELRDRAGATGGADGDKIELILERTSRIDELRELEPLMRQVKEAANLGGNDKVVALLRQLIEHVQTMPSKFDGKETMDNVFQSLRRLEQQQEQQAATLRRLVASVAESEERISHAMSNAQPARQSMRFVPPTRQAAPLAPAPGSPRGDTDIDPEIESMFNESDPNYKSKRRVPLVLTIALIVAIPLVGAYTIMNWNGLKNVQQWFESTPTDNGTNRSAPAPTDGGDSELTRR